MEEASKKHVEILELTKLETIEDLNKARIIAKDRIKWKKLSKTVCNIA